MYFKKKSYIMKIQMQAPARRQLTLVSTAAQEHFQTQSIHGAWLLNLAIFRNACLESVTQTVHIVVPRVEVVLQVALFQIEETTNDHILNWIPEFTSHCWILCEDIHVDRITKQIDQILSINRQTWQA